jgi:multidrug efflux pump subunit AcrA (membrane-fusion protein)
MRRLIGIGSLVSAVVLAGVAGCGSSAPSGSASKTATLRAFLSNTLATTGAIQATARTQPTFDATLVPRTNGQ